VDGVLGLWWLELMQSELSVFEYTILHADLETVLQRTADRAKTSQVSANPALVGTMHDQFDSLSGMEKRTITTTGKTTADVVEEFMKRQREGDFA
jgi:hypothetical protein